MLIDITLQPEDAFQITRHADGKVTLTVPLDLLIRANAAYVADKAKFEDAARAASH